MISTILKNPPVGFENHFAGNFEQIPEDRLAVENFYNGNLTKPILIDGTWTEGESEQEKQERVNSIIAKEREKYQSIIDKLLSPYVQKLVIDGDPIPQYILDKREELKQEFHNLINNL